MSQIAHQGIELLGRNGSLPRFLQNVTSSSKQCVAFCVGRLVREIPIGLIIYAGRNQHVHLAEESLREPTNSVLTRLGLLYRREQGEVHSKSPEILEILDWDGREAYERDMRSCAAM